MELFAVISILLALTHESGAVRHVVYWDRDLIPKLADGGLEITLEIDDYMDVLCPYSANFEGFFHPRRHQALLQIYNVTRQQYLECDTTGAIRLQTCDKPGIEKKLTTKFQERSPYPFGFTFRPGATYYYLSKPLQDSIEGCTQETMRMLVHVNRKGTVFDPNDHERTRTYHLTHHEDPRNKDPGFNHRPEHTRKRNHPHHHSKATTASPTKPPKVIIQYETPRYPVRQARAKSVRRPPNPPRDPENGAMKSRSPAFTTLILASALTIFLTYIWSRQ